MDRSARARGVVHIVDDDAAMRDALSLMLELSGYEVRTYASARAFLGAPRDDRLGCALLDVRMPGLSGLDLQDALIGDGSRLPVVFLTGHGDIPMSVRAVKAGAVDFLTKPVKKKPLLAAIEAALARDAERHAEREELRALRARFERLTPRERDVLALVVSGKLNKNTASDLGIAERTVKLHRAHVMEKLQAASLADLVRLAQRLGIGPLAPKG